MKPEYLEYVRYNVRRSEETLEAAKLLLENDHLPDTVNRLYYACFYAVCALLWTENVSSSKHTGVRSLFGQYWIRTGRLPVSLAAFYNSVFDRRDQADYRRVVFNREDVESWFGEARTFITALAAKVDEQIATETPNTNNAACITCPVHVDPDDIGDAPIPGLADEERTPDAGGPTGQDNLQMR